MSIAVDSGAGLDLDALRLGFIGSGTITSAIVTGLRANGASRPSVTLSPRNAAVAQRLARTHPGVTVATGNQHVLDASDVVLLAVRPQVAADVLAELRFRPQHRVISLVATFSHARISSLVAPASHAACAVPMPTVASHLGPTPIYPPDAVAAALFDRLGTAIEVTAESELQMLWASTAAMASFFTVLHTIEQWLVSHGVTATRARAHVAMMFDGLARVPRSSDLSFLELAEEFKTKGGLNEQYAAGLARAGAFDAWSAAADGVLARIQRGA